MNSDHSTAYQAGYFFGTVFFGLLGLGMLVFFIVALVKAFTRKTPGWIITAVVTGLFSLVTIVAGAASTLAKITRLASDAVKPTKVLTSKDGGHQIAVPDSWVSMPNLNAQAVIGAGNGLKENYVIVLIEDKAKVGADLATYMKITADRMTSALDQGHQGELTELTIAGYPAQRRVITGRSKGPKSLNVVYQHTCVETDRDLVQLLFWTLAGREGAALPLFEKVAATFRPTGKPTSDDKPSSGATVKSVASPSATVKSATTPQR